MPLIASIDGPNRRIYLDISTVNAAINPIDLYKEARTLRRLDETLRKYVNFISSLGGTPTGTGKFTQRITVLEAGTRIFMYDTNQELTIVGKIITDDGKEGARCFDRSNLTATTLYADITYNPPQVELINVAVAPINSAQAITIRSVI